MSRADARYALEGVMGKRARRQFRRPYWPVSRWGADLCGDRVDTCDLMLDLPADLALMVQQHKDKMRAAFLLGVTVASDVLTGHGAA
jgi:hypothetical protein